jgi:cobalamin-dependent methionine synthase I
LIPNIKKFNDVEENFIKNHLTDLCFKDAARKIHQEEISTKIIQNDLPESVSLNNNIVLNNSNNNLNYGNNIQSDDNEYLQRKKNRSMRNNTTETTKKTVLYTAKKAEQTNGENENNTNGNNVTTVGIKLICESEIEDLKKYFSKTVFLIFYEITSRNCIQTMIYPLIIFLNTYVLNKIFHQITKRRFHFLFMRIIR